MTEKIHIGVSFQNGGDIFMKYQTYILAGIGLAIVLVVAILFQTIDLQDPMPEKGKSSLKIDDKTEMEFVKEYQECGTEKRLNQDYPPEIFQNMDFTGYTEQELKNFLPDHWSVAEFKQDNVILEYNTTKKYSAHKDSQQVADNSNSDYQGYISVYQGKIAVFKGDPPEGELIEVTRYDVKDVYFDELQEGIEFDDEQEKEQILESYTS